MPDQRAEVDPFCSHCEVRLSLHPSQQETDDEWECEVANIKADVLARFDRVFLR